MDQINPPKTRKKLKIALIVTAVLLVGAAGFAVWQTVQLNTQTSKASSLETTTAALQSQIDVLKSDPGSTLPPDTPVSSTDNPELDGILSAVDAYVRAPVAAVQETFHYHLEKSSGKFARVSVSVESGGGYSLWLKKVEETWTVLFGGQDNPTQELIDKYGLPNDL